MPNKLRFSALEVPRETRMSDGKDEPNERDAPVPFDEALRRILKAPPPGKKDKGEPPLGQEEKREEE